MTLCLPQKAVVDTLSAIPKDKKVLECSNEFRCHSDWVYGLPELGNDVRLLIKKSNRVVNPGCFASAFILILRPLLLAGKINANSIVSAFAINGYSAGGSRMIELYEKKGLDGQIHGLNQNHRHIPEMMQYSGLTQAPLFIPSIGNYREGLTLSVPIYGYYREEVISIFSQAYHDEKLIHVRDSQPDKISPVCESLNSLEIFVTGTERNLIITVRMSNLLKGAASNAVQNINLMLGFEECLGL